ncbi:hypothetical protein MNBD_GAMMA21-2597 [hydrothermal vent metagenome]|uniref:DUF5329 domain-containing protein n=1 Tax=hydrothermal vent metagenome TaxID=652676 RepID=A0A3B0ZX67_9ZZZZ
MGCAKRFRTIKMTMNKKLIKLFVLLFFVSGVGYADVPTKQVKEVKHLLSFVRDSGCIINRNGSEYPSAKGVKHIQRKYDYFRDDIKSTEDFIELAATKSTMSGKYYTVTCPGKEKIKTQDWLLTELKRFREN